MHHLRAPNLVFLEARVFSPPQIRPGAGVPQELADAGPTPATHAILTVLKT